MGLKPVNLCKFSLNPIHWKWWCQGGTLVCFYCFPLSSASLSVALMLQPWTRWYEIFSIFQQKHMQFLLMKSSTFLCEKMIFIIYIYIYMPIFPGFPLFCIVFGLAIVSDWPWLGLQIGFSIAAGVQRVRRDLRQKRTGQTAPVTPRPPSIWEQKKACIRGELSGSVKGLVGNFEGNHGFSGVYPINPLVKAEWEFPAMCQTKQFWDTLLGGLEIGWRLYHSSNY